MRASVIALLLASLPLGTLAEIPAPADDLANARTIHVLTTDADGDERKTKIWVAVVNGEAYVRTGDTRWFENLARDSALTVVLDKKLYPAVAVRVHEATRIDEVDAAFRAKHPVQDRLVSLFGGGDNILRLDAPAQP